MAMHDDTTPLTAGASGEAVSYKDIEGFPGYRVGTDGTVWSCLTNHGELTSEWHLLKPRWSKRKRRVNYFVASVTVRRGGQSYWRTVHRLVLEAFVGPRLPGMECRHLDGNTKNNRLSNICWGSRL